VLWLSVRQFRTQVVLAACVLVALAVVVVIVGSQALSDYHATVISGTLNDFVDKYQSMGQWLSGLVLVVPGLIGVFWGAPLLARELESGTFRLAWTQSISRTRWTLCKLGLLGLAGMAVAGLCSLLVTWWSSSLDLAVGTGPFANFDVRGIVPVAYAAFAFTLGVAAGAVIRQTVAAMGVTLVLFAAVRVMFREWLRPHLMAPVVARTPFTVTSLRRIQIGAHLPQGAWMVSSSLVNGAGHAVNGGVVGLFNNLSAAVSRSDVSLPGVGSCPNLTPSAKQLGNPNAVSGLVTRCVNQLHNLSAGQPLLALPDVRVAHLPGRRRGRGGVHRLVGAPPQLSCRKAWPTSSDVRTGPRRLSADAPGTNRWCARRPPPGAARSRRGGSAPRRDAPP
jgi:hypothetical protein